MERLQKDITNFVAKGKPVDNIRPDVRVEIISAKINKIEQKGKAFNAEFSIEGEQYPHNGFISENELVYKLLCKALKMNQLVTVRLERKRKKGVDPSLKIMDLTKDMGTAKKNAVKTTVGIFDYSTKKWILTNEAESSPEEDPADTLSKIESVNFDSDGFFSQPSKTNNQQAYKSTNRELEKKTDSLMTLMFFVIEIAKNNEVKLESKQIQEYTEILSASCDFVQKSIFKLKNPNYSDYSYTRTRFLLFNYEEHMKPLNKESLKNSESMKVWAKSFIEVGIKLWKWASVTAQK